jgi:hypothetical protein
MTVEVRAASVGYRLAQRILKGQLVRWWQRLENPEDIRQPCWLERRQALSYMYGASKGPMLGLECRGATVGTIGEHTAVYVNR